MYNSVELMIQVNQNLLAQLITVPEEILPIGEIFLSVVDSFKSYTEFCVNQEHYVAFIAQLLRTVGGINPLANQYDLDSYFIKPIQRICSK